MFITFEGIDGSGKSTQIKLLKQSLIDQGHSVYVFREPGGTELSEKVRRILLNPGYTIHPVTELLLFSSARAQLISEKVKPLLEKGDVVILDRFYDSTIAYQGFGRSSLPVAEIQKLNDIASHHLEPDITFYLRISLKEAQKRTARHTKDRMELSGQAFYNKVIEGFEYLEENLNRFIGVDATGSPEQIHELIMQEMKNRF